MLERVGKATRNPPRDVMLSEAGTHMGRGWAFGVNEALDQIGAFLGPLAVAAMLRLARRLSARLSPGWRCPRSPCCYWCRPRG